MKDSFDAVAAKLEENEISLSDLYALFARTFPEDATLWTELSADETKHAGWINRLRQAVRAGTIQPAETSARLPAVEMALQYNRTLAGRCRNGALTRMEALGNARNIENGMLERNVFRALGGASREFKDLQDLLTRETSAHRDKIGKAMSG